MNLLRWRFFDTPAHDARYLDLWRAAPRTYREGDVIRGAHTDHYEERMADAVDASSFKRAVDALLRYHFYPDDIMHHTSDFSVQNRHMRRGDRIVQRIRVPGLGGLVAVLTMNEVVQVNDEARLAGFAYATTAQHDEIGQWSARLDWRADHSLWLTVDSYGWPNVPWFMRASGRRFQLFAHQRGIANFRRVIASQS
jgi:uncharacterized protein (UPF0548 family)